MSSRGTVVRNTEAKTFWQDVLALLYSVMTIALLVLGKKIVKEILNSYQGLKGRQST